MSCFFPFRLLTKAVRNDSISVQTSSHCPPLRQLARAHTVFRGAKQRLASLILVDGRQPIFLVCLPSRRLSSVKNSEGLADRSGALSARQRTTACWRMARTITQQTAVQSGTQARVPLSADAWRSLHFIRFVANIGPDTWPGCFYRSAGAATIGRLPQVGAAFPRLCELAAGAASLAAIFMISGGLLCRSLRSGS